jgi:hypothetical protein
VEVPGIPIGYVPRKGNIKVQIESLFRIVPILRVTVQNPPSFGEFFFQDFQYIGTRLAIVDDYREIQPFCQFQLPNKKLNLTVSIAEFSIVVQPDFSEGYDSGKFGSCFYFWGPVSGKIGHFRRGYPDTEEHVGCGFQVFVNLKEIE